MIFERSYSGLKKQQGIATLVTVLVLLIATTITAFTISSSIISEKQVVADEQRAAAALEAANAGLANGVNFFRENGQLPTAESSGLVGSGSEERWSYRGVSSSSGSGDIEWVIISEGKSDDDSVVRRIQMTLDYAKLDLPNAPVVTAAAPNFSGDFEVVNLSGNTTIWTGQSVNISSNAFSTKIPNPLDPDTLIKSSTINYRGSDIIENDPNLAGLDEDQFQQAFLGSTVEEFCEQGFIDRNDYSTGGPGETSFKEALQNAGTVVCIRDTSDGDVEIPTDTFDGSVQKTIIIDGNWDQSNSNTFRGLVFVTQDVKKLTGNSPIYGSLMAFGEVGNGAGTPSIIFNSDYTTDLGDSSDATAISGTWRDW